MLLRTPFGAAIIAIHLFVGFAEVQASGIRTQDSRIPRGHGASPGQSYIGFAPSIQAIAVTKRSVIYAGSFGMGVFRSEDRGTTWSSVPDGLTDPFVLCLETDDNRTIYAGTVRGGVYRMREGSQSWESINTGLKRVEVKALLVHGQTLYAGTGRGVYQWNTRQQQWAVVAGGLDQILVPALVMVGDRKLFAGTAGKGLFHHDTSRSSSEAWSTWSGEFIDPKERLSHKFIRVLAMGEDQHIYLGTQDGGLYGSTDRGRSWKSIGRSLPNDSIRSIIPSQKGLYVATGRGVFKSFDQGERWIGINTGLTELSIQVLVEAQPGTLLAGTSSGVFRSSDGGKHWVNVSEGLGTQTKALRPYP